MPTMKAKYSVMKRKGRGYVQVTQDIKACNENNWKYKIVEFKCVRDITKASLWDNRPHRQEQVKGYFQGVIDMSKVEFVDRIVDAEYMTL
jgi:hypothetical protein